MNLPRNPDAALPIVGPMLSQPREREEPHGEIVEVLAVPVRRFPDPEAAGPAEDALDIGYEALRRVNPDFLPRLSKERDVQHDAERVGPEISQAVGPDALLAHPRQLSQDVLEVPDHRQPSSAGQTWSQDAEAAKRGGRSRPLNAVRQ